MNPTNAQASALPDGQEAVQEPVTPKSPEQPAKTPVVPDAKKEEAVVSSEKEDDDLSQKPFHEHPRFQKMNREIKTLKSVGKEALELIRKQNEKLEQMYAEQKGEEYKPPQEVLVKTEDLFDQLDEGLDTLQKEEKLSDSEREEIYSLAEKYAEDTEGGQKVPLRPDIAYKLWKDMGGGKKAPDTRPSKSVKETSSMTMDFPQKFRNTSEMYAQLRKQASTFNNL